MIHRFSFSLLSLLLAVTFNCLGCHVVENSIQEQIYKDAIQRVMHESSLTGTEPSDEHISTLRSIDLTNCPPEFRLAFAKYIHAWEEQAAVRKAEIKLSNDELPSAGEQILANVFDLNLKPWQEHQQAVEQVRTYKTRAESDLTSTARNLDDLAVKYGLHVGP